MAADYRGYVGPRDRYDLIGAMQFNLLTSLGLRDHHSLLDIGCGSLRAGRLFIPYLLPEKYFGIEPNAWLVEKGIDEELGRSVLAVKRPRFHDGADFNLSVFGQQFDFILAQSVFTHAAKAQIRKCLMEASKVMSRQGMFCATYLVADTDYEGSDWVYPGCARYKHASIERFAVECGLDCQQLEYHHPNGHAWVVFKHHALA
jgi:cyclopropane fatty-acyl-phospholipid synthase-like methyltransferase